MFALQTPLLPSFPGKDCNSDVKVIVSRSCLTNGHLLNYFPLKLQPCDSYVPLQHEVVSKGKSRSEKEKWNQLKSWKTMSPNGFRTEPNVTDECHSKGMLTGKWGLEWWLLLMTGDVLERVPRQNTSIFFHFFLWAVSNLHLLWLPRGALQMHQVEEKP